jgi:hypothetical protein
MKDQTYIEKVDVYKVANGHVIQVKLVGVSTEHTFICSREESLAEAINDALAKLLEEKI